jgi:hypothetical protein
MDEARKYYCDYCGEKLRYEKPATSLYDDKTGKPLRCTYYLECPRYLYQFPVFMGRGYAHSSREIVVLPDQTMPGYEEWLKTKKAEAEKADREQAEIAARRRSNREKISMALAAFAFGLVIGFMF